MARDVSLDKIGPIRSARHYFLDYAMEHDAVYAHYGWSPYAERDIKNLEVNNINGMTDSGVFARDSSIAAPHNVFTTTARLRNYFSNKNYDSAQASGNSWTACAVTRTTLKSGSRSGRTLLFPPPDMRRSSWRWYGCMNVPA